MSQFQFSILFLSNPFILIDAYENYLQISGDLSSKWTENLSNASPLSKSKFNSLYCFIGLSATFLQPREGSRKLRSD